MPKAPSKTRRAGTENLGPSLALSPGLPPLSDYFSSALAPASSNFFFRASASAFDTAFFDLATGFGQVLGFCQAQDR